MKNLKNLFVLFIISMAVYSCDADISIDNPKSDTLENISADNGEQENNDEGRNG